MATLTRNYTLLSIILLFSQALAKILAGTGIAKRIRYFLGVFFYLLLAIFRFPLFDFGLPVSKSFLAYFMTFYFNCLFACRFVYYAVDVGKRGEKYRMRPHTELVRQT